MTQAALLDEQADSDLVTEVADEPVKHGPWSQQSLLLARLIDEVAWLRFAVVRTAPGNDKYPEPIPLSRPGVAAAPRRAVASGGLAEAAVIYLNARRAPREAST